MKSGSPQIAAMYLHCPHCGESFDDTQDGSQLVSMHNFRPEQVGKPVTCSACGEQYRVPTSMRKVFP